MLFDSATTLHNHSRIAVNEPLRSVLDYQLLELVSGSFVVIEGENLKSVHAGFHRQMIDAFTARWQVQFIDVANCFNPHVLASFNHDLILDDILLNITLARPFQYYQSVSLLDSLIFNLVRANLSNNLVLISALDNQLMELDQQSQLEIDFTHILGGLQNIAVNGNIVIVSNTIREACNSIFKAYATTHIKLQDERVVVSKHPIL